MKNLHIAVRINIELINKTGINSILLISAQDTALGFIHVEESMSHDTPDRITPFTAEGVLPESDCYSCAVRTLVARHVNLPEEALDLAEALRSPAEMLAAMLAGVSHARRTAH